MIDTDLSMANFIGVFTLDVNKNEKINELSQRFHLSQEAVMTLFQALLQGKGTMAQFNHPELGGAGQWMSGGMVMLGDMFNHALKAKINDICAELAHWILSSQLLSTTVPHSSDAWWPSELGEPNLVGSQNHTHYAYFTLAKRLVIRTDEQLAIYDTQDHHIHGVSQQQGTSLAFTSQKGQVILSTLPLLSGKSTTQASQKETQPTMDKKSKKSRSKKS